MLGSKITASKQYRQLHNTIEMTTNEAKAIITSVSELKQNYAVGDEFDELEANDSNKVSEALRTLVGAYEVLQDVDPDSSPVFAGRRYLKSLLSSSLLLIPTVKVDNTANQYRIEELKTIDELKALLGTGGNFGNKVETIAASDESTEFGGYYEKTITIKGSAFTSINQWNFSALRCYRLLDDSTNPYEESVAPYRIKRFNNSFKIVVPVTCNVYYSVQTTNL